jgi:hypothetical protein
MPPGALPNLPHEKRLTSESAFPKDIVAAMHSMLSMKGPEKMPVRIVLEAKDVELLRDHFLNQLPADQDKYSDLHWAMLRHCHSHEVQRDWIRKHTVTK